MDPCMRFPGSGKTAPEVKNVKENGPSRLPPTANTVWMAWPGAGESVSLEKARFCILAGIRRVLRVHTGSLHRRGVKYAG